MDLRDILNVLVRRWRFVVAVAVLGLVVGAVLSSTATPKYRAQTQLFVAARDQATDPSNAYEGGLFSQERVTSYVDLIDKQQVLQPVVDSLHLPYTWQHLATEVSASSPAGTVLIDVSVLDPSPERAQAVANAISSRFTTFVAQLETLGTDASPVKVSVAQEADLPAKPATPNVPLDVLRGLALGLLLGVAGAFVRNALDTTVKDDAAIARAGGLATMGSVPFDKDAVRNPLFLNSAEGSRAEPFRQLRTNLQFAHVDDQPRSILVTSSVAAEGKTTTACNLAIALAQVGVDVILVDADLRRPRVAATMGLDGASGLTSVLVGWAPLADVIQNWGPADLSLRVVASGPTPPNAGELLASEAMRQVLEEMEDLCDVVVLDGAPLLPVADSVVLSAAVSGALIVVRHGKTRRDQLVHAVRAVEAVNGVALGAVRSMTPKLREGDYYYTYSYQKPAAPLPEPPRVTSPRVPTPTASEPAVRRVVTYRPLPEPSSARDPIEALRAEPAPSAEPGTVAGRRSTSAQSNGAKRRKPTPAEVPSEPRGRHVNRTRASE